MSIRLNKVGCKLGKRGSGKTYHMRMIMKFYAQYHPKMGQLVMDTLDHPSYRHIPSITLEQLKKWNGKGVYRIFGSNTDEIFEAIANHVWNALIVFEDASKYIRRELPDHVRNFILDSKQKNLDLIFMFHGFGYMPPEMFRCIDYFSLHKCDNPQNRKNYIIGYEQVEAAWKEVMADPFPYKEKTVEVY